jgi:hypothetical protein
MDSGALLELIARVRGTVADLAESEQKLAALRGELAQQERAKPVLKRLESMPKRTDLDSGWQFVL